MQPSYLLRGSMKALILAGGKGTRLRPLTYTAAKQLIPIANKPTILFGIESIIEAGITDIGIIVGDTRNEIRTELGDGSKFGAKFTYIEQDEPLGLAHAVLIAEEFMAGEPFLMYLGDNLVQNGVKTFVEDFRANRPNAMVLLNPVQNPSSFGVVVLKDGQIERLVEKPKEPPSDLALVGVYFFDSTVFQAVKSIKPSKRNELEITDALQWLVDQGYVVAPHVIHKWWKDTGKPEDMLEANRIVLGNRKHDAEILGEVDEHSSITPSVDVQEGAQIRNSIVRGPAIIGRNAVIEDAYIGPFTSIGANVKICNAEVENSIVCDDAVIRDVQGRLDGCLLGRGVSIISVARKPTSSSFVLGDNSSIVLSR